MAVSATRTRPSDSSAKPVRIDAAAVLEAVSGLFSDGDEHTVAQLRVELGVGATGPTESQLSRALRQLVDSGTLARVRRGVYAEARRSMIVPMPRSASATEKFHVSDIADESDAPSDPLPAVPPTSVSLDQESIESIPVETKAIARPLSAAPNRPRRPKRSPATGAAVPATIPSADVVIDSVVAPPATPAEESVDAPTVSDEAPEIATAETPDDGGLVLEAVLPRVASAEVPEVDAPVLAKTETELEQPAAVAIELDVAPTQIATTASVTTAVIAAPAPAPELAAFDDNFTALDAERVWVRKAALPVIWFAITGLALMLAGSIIGVVVGVVLGAAALWLYVGLRARDRATNDGYTGPPSQAADAPTELESIGVK